MDANTPKISEVMRDFAFQAGYAVDARFASLNAAVTTRIDNEVAALTGQDANFSQLITNLLRISDADEGTAEWEEGQNLYTLMTNNYVTLTARIDSVEGTVTALNAWKATFVGDYNTAIAAISTRIDTEVAERKSEVTRLEGLISTAAAKGNANESEITVVKQRLDDAEAAITALQAKRDTFTSDIELIKSKFEGLDASNTFGEFYAGLHGAVSPSGVAAPAL